MAFPMNEPQAKRYGLTSMIFSQAKNIPNFAISIQTALFLTKSIGHPG